MGSDRHLWFIIVLMAVCPPACRQRQGQDAGREHPTRFLAFVGIGQDDALWGVLRASARRAYNELGLSSPVLRTVAPAISSVNAQKKLIEELRRQGMGALCIQVTEPEALAGTLDSLAHRGVRVVTMVRPVATKVELVHVGYDDKAIGTALADAIAEAIDYEGRIALLHADSVSPASAKRRAAFLTNIARYPKVRVMLEYDCEATPALAVRLLADTMRRYPRLSGWAVMGSWPLRERDSEAGLVPPGCRLVAVDPFPAWWRLLETGVVSAMVASDYDELAKQAVTASLADLGGGGRMPVSFEAPVRIIRVDKLGAFKRDWSQWTSENGLDKQ